MKIIERQKSSHGALLPKSLGRGKAATRSGARARELTFPVDCSSLRTTAPKGIRVHTRHECVIG